MQIYMHTFVFVYSFVVVGGIGMERSAHSVKIA